MTKRHKGVEIETWEHPRYKAKVVVKLDRGTGEFFAYYGETEFRKKDLGELRHLLALEVERLVNLEWIPIIEVKVKYYSHNYRMKRVGDGRMRAARTSDEVKLAERADDAESELHLNFRRYWIAKAGKIWLHCDLWFSRDGADTERYEFSQDHKIDDPNLRRLNSSEWHPDGKVDLENFTLPVTAKSKWSSNYGDERIIHYLPFSEELWQGLNEIAGKIEDLGNKIDELIKSKDAIALISGLAGNLLPEYKAEE